MNNIEKSHFDENNYDLKDLISEICDNWKRQYASLNFTIKSDKDFIISISYDIINVIFDNLILNSIQQNDKQSILNININIGAYENKIYCKSAPMKTAVIWNRAFIDTDR